MPSNPGNFRVSDSVNAYIGRGKYKLTMNVQSLVKRIGRGADRAFRRLAPQIEAHLKANVGIQGPPRSTQGNPPHKDTGVGHASVEVRAVVGGGTKNSRIEVKAVDYMGYLDHGFTHAWSGKWVHRPWVRDVFVGNRGILETTVRQLRKEIGAELASVNGGAGKSDRSHRRTSGSGFGGPPSRRGIPWLIDPSTSTKGEGFGIRK